MSIVRETTDRITNYTTDIDVFKKVAENWGKPFEEWDNGDYKLKIYLDQNQNIFLACGVTGSAPKMVKWRLYHDNQYTDITQNNQNMPLDYFYTDCNANGTVLLFRAKASPYTNSAMLVAKDQSGDWACFINNIMITKNGTFNLTAASVNVYDNVLYSAFITPNVDNGKNFDGLYKIFSARSKSETNLYVDFNGKPFRIVSMDTGTSNVQWNPSYAFEARQE